MTLAGSMSDVLAGSSLVVAILAAFFSIWQPDITGAIGVVVRPDPLNRAGEKKLVDVVLYTKILPLLGIAVAALCVLAPRAVILVIHSGACAVKASPRSECFYDDVGALFLLTEVLLIGLIAAVAAQLNSILKKRGRLHGP